MPDDLMLNLIGAREAEWAVYLMAGDQRARETYGHLAEKDVAVVSVGGDWDWNRDLTPWKAPRCARGGEDFGGGAGAYLLRLSDRIPAFEAEAGLHPGRRALAGYSLAGLFSLYAMYMADLFDAAAVVSGSVWFKDFIEFMRANETKKPRPRMYFSVGDREKRTRNPWFSTIEDKMREATDILRARGAEVVFHLETGNHFADENPRVARGIDWIVCGGTE
jgi:predicted alpha/beta superfamily hydrolase